jgi:hypothetical protein
METLLRILIGLFMAALFGVFPVPVGAQTAAPAPVGVGAPLSTPQPVPAAYALDGVSHFYQSWNNCGPATLAMSLSYFGASLDQNTAGAWLKPNPEDKNVSPWQIVTYVNDELDGTTRALMRQGGTLTLLKTLIAHNFPVMIEAGYDPADDPQGWMGHYLFVSGYNDAAAQFTTQDSFEGPNQMYDYAYLDGFWRHFNRVYIVFYPVTREAELLALLGPDADEAANARRTLEAARAEAVADPNDAFAWFNMGTSFVSLNMMPEAATAYDQARNLGLPFRMLWYQFGPFEAYLAVGRYTDVIGLAQANLNDGGGQFVEETFYYGGLARYGMGERERALSNLDGAIAFNPNFTPAREARERILGAS